MSWNVSFTNPIFINCYRDAVSDLALHFFEKMKIMVVKDIEREDIEFVCKVCAITLLSISLIDLFISTLDFELPSYRQFGSFPPRVHGIS